MSDFLTNSFFQGSSSKSSAAEVEIIRYQVRSQHGLQSNIQHSLEGLDPRDGGSGASLQPQGCGQPLLVGAHTSQIPDSAQK